MRPPPGSPYPRFIDVAPCVRLSDTLGVVFDFGAHFFGQDSVAAHAVRAGFATCDDDGADELWRRYLRGEPHPAAWVFRMIEQPRGPPLEVSRVERSLQPWG